MKRYLRAFLFLPILAILFFPIGNICRAQEQSVHSILFYSPTCPHCHTVIQEHLPPLIEKYGDQLRILAINVSDPQGQALYQSTVQHLQVPQDRLGVPALLVGEILLVGSHEIPTYFPDMIDKGLLAGGIGWPDIPGLHELLVNQGLIEEEPIDIELTMGERFVLDPVANTISVIVLIGMGISVFILGFTMLSKTRSLQPWPSWTIPLLSLIGLGISIYLGFVEVTQTEAVCGPVGDCNTVQQSDYARLFGLIPIGLLGIAGYVVIMVTWWVSKYGSSRVQASRKRILWIMAFAGTIFSIYLTYLEPFVIGATCAWCLSSAVVITLVLWSSTTELGGPRRYHPATR